MEARSIKINMLSGAVAIINACLLFNLAMFNSGEFEGLSSLTRNVFYLFIVMGLSLHASGIFLPKIGPCLTIAHILGFVGCVVFLINPLMALKLSLFFFVSSILISIKMFKHN